MHPEFWIGLFYGAFGVGLLWSVFELWTRNKRVQAWLAREQLRIDSETVLESLSERSKPKTSPNKKEYPSLPPPPKDQK